ncbi:MAG: FAD-dependent oxidoreductase [Polyangiaceae bacterium]
MKRRELLIGIGAGWLLDQSQTAERPIAGHIVGANHRVGHMLRGNIKKSPGKAEQADVVVVGSGISGLSAAWRLTHAGVACHMLELETFAGGTSTWGEVGAVAHPWGAHYLPVPEREARVPLRLLDALGVVRGFDAAGRPRFDGKLLCHAPEERLHYHGAWHRGLVPFSALTSEQKSEFDRFRGWQEKLKFAKGNDGRHAFVLPTMLSSRDPAYLALDKISMATWLDREGFHDPFIRWYVEYATRDDFGASLTQTSAWAAWHYFCARRLTSDQLEGSRFLVWPEGNGWLVKQLLARVPLIRRHGALVTQVSSNPKGGVRIDYFDVSTRLMKRIEARGAVLAVPGFVMRRLVGDVKPPDSSRREGSAWLVANLHVTRPREAHDVWDTILHDSPSLGYIDASHQLSPPRDRTVLTYYRPYVGDDPRAERQALLASRWNTLTSDIFLDLTRVHPKLVQQTERVDIMRWGHAMPRPTPGFLGSSPWQESPMLDERIAWAHVDQSGMALFEEASTRGVAAAEALAPKLGVATGESWL